MKEPPINFDQRRRERQRKERWLLHVESKCQFGVVQLSPRRFVVVKDTKRAGIRGTLDGTNNVYPHKTFEVVFGPDNYDNCYTYIKTNTEHMPYDPPADFQPESDK